MKLEIDYLMILMLKVYPDYENDMFKIGDEEEEEEEGQQSAKAPSNSEGNSGTSTKNIRITRLTRIIKMLLVHSRYNTIIIIRLHTKK